MTRDEVIRMAREAGFSTSKGADGVAYADDNEGTDITGELERFAEMVATWQRGQINGWIDEGEELAASGRRSALFRFGEWWADRPFR